MPSNLEKLQKELERKVKLRAKKKKPKMLVSGKSVLGLRRIIKNKGQAR